MGLRNIILSENIGETGIHQCIATIERKTNFVNGYGFPERLHEIIINYLQKTGRMLVNVVGVTEAISSPNSKWLFFFFLIGEVMVILHCWKSKKNIKRKSIFVTANCLCVKYRQNGQKCIQKIFYAYLMATSLSSFWTYHAKKTKEAISAWATYLQIIPKPWDKHPYISKHCDKTWGMHHSWKTIESMWL